MQNWQDELKRTFTPASWSVGEEDLRLHSFDTWPVAAKWRNQGVTPHAPELVFRPRSTADVSRLLAWANARRVPVTPWGAGSGVTGAALPLKGGICLDLSEMTEILVLDEMNLLVKAQAGLLGWNLEQVLNGRGFTLNHSPQSLDRATIGGFVATRATGQFSSRYGGIEDLLAGITVVLADGQVVETGPGPRAAMGPDIKAFFTGSEGTLGVITEVTLKIFPLPESRLLETVRFPSLESGLIALRRVAQVGLKPFLARLYDQDEARQNLGLDPAPGGFLMLGFEGLPAVAQAEWEVGLEVCRQEGGEPSGPEISGRWMERRFDFSMVESILARPGGFAETIEVAHLWEGILPTYQALKAALAPLAGEVLGHFSHIYPQGTSLYIILLGQAEADRQAEDRLLKIWETAMRTTLDQGAVLSHHHGVGLARLPYIRQALGSQWIVLDRLKSALDPNRILNPGKFGLD